ncbi:hypothetical protein [Caproiciproducens sp.]
MKRVLAALFGICVGALLYTGINLLKGGEDGVSAGVIGGADGPTSIWVSHSFNAGLWILLAAGVILAAAAFYLLRRRGKQK